MTLKSSTTLVQLQHCSLVLDGHTVLDDVNFDIRAGERWALIGANGSGKTMLLKMIRGDMWPTPLGKERREYRFDGVTTREPAGHKHRIVHVGSERQDKYVRYDWNLTVTQIVTTGLFDEDIPLSKPTAAQRAKVERMMRRFGIHGLRKRRFLSLSYGQRRLALVARAFVSEAELLLLDEVFNGLDVKAKAKLRLALEAPRQRHAWILTSHRPQELPANVTHLATLQHGRLTLGALDSSPSELTGKGEKPRKAVHRERQRSAGGISFPSSLRPVAAIPAAGAQTSPRQRREMANDWLLRITNANIYRDYRPVIRNLDWTVHRGEHWAVLGANGSGKSTLLSLLHGDLHPALGGTIERQGVPFGTRIEAWKQRVGWVSPELQADHYLARSMEEIVMSGRYASVGLNAPPTRTDRRVATRWLRFFGIEHLRERGPRQVSYGQMRLALFARAMANEPELLLLDEPCTGLDGDVRAQVLNVLQQLAEQKTQLIMAVHDASDIVPAVRCVLRIGRGGRAEASSY